MKRMLTIEADISSAWIILKQHDYHLLAKSHTLLLLNILLLFSGGGKAATDFNSEQLQSVNLSTG
jgi:hypothetical protein